VPASVQLNGNGMRSNYRLPNKELERTRSTHNGHLGPRRSIQCSTDEMATVTR
jgi:hypothetical protein